MTVDALKAKISKAIYLNNHTPDQMTNIAIPTLREMLTHLAAYESENLVLRAGLENMRQDHERYEYLRSLELPAVIDLFECARNARNFDEIVDEARKAVTADAEKVE